MKKLLGMCLVFLSLFIVFAPVYAFNRAGAFSLSLGAGYEWFSSKRHLQKTNLIFGAAGYDFDCNWGAEAFLATFKTRNNSDIPEQERRGVSGTFFAIDGVYHFNPYRAIQPFVLAGVGITGLNPNRFDAHNEGNINGAIGFQWFIDPVIAFRAEARDIYTINGGKNDVMVTIGMSFVGDVC